MDLQEIVPVFIVGIVFFTAAVIVATVFLFLHRAKELKHQTIRLALERGQPVPAGLLDEGAQARTPASDLNTGVKALFVGIGLSLFFFFVYRDLWPVGLIAGFIGLGHIAAWLLTGRPGADEAAAQ